MDRRKRIAVVIPCFNDGPTLPEASRSAQSVPNCEVVVVDDGSTDRLTLDTFRDLEADGVRVIHQENQGISAARRRGVAETTAPYVLPLDADDYVIPGGVTALVDHLDTHPEVDVVWGRYRYVGERNHEKAVARELDPWLITYLNDIPASALFRRHVLDDTGGWSFESGREDWDLWMTLAARNACGVGLSIPVYCHRLHVIRMNRGARPREAELFSKLEARHRVLFDQRQRNRKRSTAPLLLKLALPVVDGLSWLSPTRRIMLGATLLHVAHRRGGYHRPLLRVLGKAKGRMQSAPLDIAAGNRA